MFDNPYAILRWIIVLIVIGSVIFRFRVFLDLFRSFNKKRINTDDDIQKKAEEILNKYRNAKNNDNTV